MSDTRKLLDTLRAAAGRGTAPGPAVRAELARVDDPQVLRRAGKILAELRPEVAGLRPVRVAVLATCTIGPYEHLLRATLVGAGLLPVIEPGAYGTFELSLAAGRFAEDGDPDVVSCLLDESYFLPDDWDPTDLEALDEGVRRRFAELRNLLTMSTRASRANLVLHTVPLPAQIRDCVLSWRARARLSRIWHRLNAEVLGLAEENPQIAVVDLVSELGDIAVAARDDRLHRYGDLPFTDGALLALAAQVRRFVQARIGLSRKVLALDLDNTLWGGVLGEDGAGDLQLGGLYPGNCYQELQRAVARLRDQGVVLVLVSKNDAGLVERALGEHPEVLLRAEMFSAMAVNWAPKAGNLRSVAESLGLATGSFVFVDDSPFERGHVEGELPEIAVVASDGDPAHLVGTVLRPGWFDVLDITGTDRRRPELYRTRTLRNDFADGFGSAEDYLRALGIELTPAPATEFTVARIAQLAARTNQFNLTGIRLDEATTAAMSAERDHIVASFSVRDRFGDEGIVGAVWAKRTADRWQVINLVLSCRVLGRGVEIAIAHWLVRRLREAGPATVEGRFIPTAKNAVAAGFWTRAGFSAAEADGTFRLDPDQEVECPDWIAIREHNEALTA